MTPFAARVPRGEEFRGASQTCQVVHPTVMGVKASAAADGRLKDEFPATLSHEPGTPLTILPGSAHMPAGN